MVPDHSPSTDERASLAQPSQFSSPLECTSHLGFSLGHTVVHPQSPSSSAPAQPYARCRQPLCKGTRSPGRQTPWCGAAQEIPSQGTINQTWNRPSGSRDGEGGGVGLPRNICPPPAGAWPSVPRNQYAAGMRPRQDVIPTPIGVMNAHREHRPWHRSRSRRAGRVRGYPIGPEQRGFAGIEFPGRPTPFLPVAGLPRHTLRAYPTGLGPAPAPPGELPLLV